VITLVNIILLCAALVLLIPAIVFSVEVALTMAPPRSRIETGGRPPRVAVVMPAHNEEALIGSTLHSVVHQLEKSDRLLVVADNCTDSTHAIATAAGAEVIERTDPIRRGKGFALDAGIRRLEADPPDVVIIIDADCQVEPGSIDRLARNCAATNRPVQALYLMRTEGDSNPRNRVAEFAWMVRNYVRPLGLSRLGLPCHLMGSGMAFPWSCISDAQLATGHLAEDLQLGIDLARAGKPPLFCPEAVVSSTFPNSIAGVRTQRTRWEHGHLGTILSEAPKLLRDSVRFMNRDLLAVALDLSVPPLALLILQIASTWIAALILFVVAKQESPLLAASLAAALLGSAVLSSWFRYGRHIITLTNLAHALIYAMMKVPMYARFIFSRQREWIRSKRE
jgi:cellulose synthase/poly-beta-1,6-N-acetylglucosamine synthase-like glycosyltransferase